MKTLDFRASARSRSKGNKWAALAMLALGLALIVLDGTIVGVSMPTIISSLELDLAGAQWVSSLYSVVFAGLLLTAGKLGDEHGRRMLFVAGLLIFPPARPLQPPRRQLLSSSSLAWSRASVAQPSCPPPCPA